MCWIRIAVPIVVLHLCLSPSAEGYDTSSLDYMKTKTCLHQMPSFQDCLNKYHHRIHGIDKDYKNAKDNESKTLCCAFWDLFECLRHPAEGTCDIEYRDLGMHLTIFNPALQAPQLCYDYPKGSWKCRFPVWLILLIVIVAAVLLTAIILLFVCIRNFR